MNIEWLLVLATVGGVIAAFEIPARQAMIVELVAREDIVDAIALNSGGFNLARIIGPSIAAIVLAKYGLAWCFAINALSYFAVLASLGADQAAAVDAGSVPRLSVGAAEAGLELHPQLPAGVGV